MCVNSTFNEPSQTEMYVIHKQPYHIYTNATMIGLHFVDLSIIDFILKSILKALSWLHA